MTFKIEHNFETRKRETERVRAKYPNKIPVIIERANKSSLPQIDKIKFLVPDDLTVGQLIYIIRKRIRLLSDQGLFIFIANTLPQSSATMAEVYKQKKDEDGFLYCEYNAETVFG